MWDFYDPSKLEGVDLIISCGDLNPRYLEFLVTLSGCPLLYVHGNHDSVYEKTPPEGCECLEDRIVRCKGLRILGLGGSMRYKEGPFMYTERQMRMRVLKARIKAALCGGVDLFVTHVPPGGCGDLEDLPHRGFTCFNTFLNAVRPRFMIHGHVHKTYGKFRRERIHESGTRIINAYDYYILEV
jgi:Icc-related predicted phosphoesterase